MIDFEEDEKFKEFMETWDFPLSLEHPIHNLRGQENKGKRVKFIKEIAVQAWNACKKNYEVDGKLREAVLNRKYWMDNPSAWNSFSQEGSDFIREFVEIAEGKK